MQADETYKIDGKTYKIQRVQDTTKRYRYMDVWHLSIALTVTLLAFFGYMTIGYLEDNITPKNTFHVFVASIMIISGLVILQKLVNKGYYGMESEVQDEQKTVMVLASLILSVMIYSFAFL